MKKVLLTPESVGDNLSAVLVLLNREIDMRLASVAASIVVLALGLGSIAYANHDEFSPPERINCRLLVGNQFRCEGFDRQVLVEDSSNAELQRGVEDTFHFIYALAYLTSDQTATVFFNYNNTKLKSVRLRTNTMFLHPDIGHGSWKKYKDGIFMCDESYMACSLTNRSF